MSYPLIIKQEGSTMKLKIPDTMRIEDVARVMRDHAAEIRDACLEAFSKRQRVLAEISADGRWLGVRPVPRGVRPVPPDAESHLAAKGHGFACYFDPDRRRMMVSHILCQIDEWVDDIRCRLDEGDAVYVAVESGTELRSRRRALGMSQAALSAALGVSSRALARWEAGDWPVPPMVPLALESLARRMG
jgi:DNA-binding XRE family transcriptional regulator